MKTRIVMPLFARPSILLPGAGGAAIIALMTAGIVNAEPVNLSLSLGDALRLAGEHDIALQSSQLDIEEGDATVGEAYSAAMPTIKATAVTGRYVVAPSSYIPAFGGRIRFQPVNDITGQMSLDQPLWLGGKVGLAVQAAQTYRKIAREGHAAARAQLKSIVIHDYFGLALARKSLEVVEETYEQAGRHVNTAEQMFNAGAASQFDLLRARTNHRLIEPEIARARQAVAVAETNLRNRLGLDPDSRIILTDEVAIGAVSTRLGLKEALFSARESRPEFRQMDLNYDLRSLALKVEERSLYWPNFFLNVTYQLQASHDHIAEVGPPDWSRGLRFQIVASVPLFDGFATEWRIEKARLALRRVELMQRQLEEGIRLEVTALLAERQRAAESVASSHAAVELAVKAFEIAELRFAQGVGTDLEVQDARLALSNARLGMLRSEYDLRVADAEYDRAVRSDQNF